MQKEYEITDSITIFITSFQANYKSAPTKPLILKLLFAFESGSSFVVNLARDVIFPKNI